MSIIYISYAHIITPLHVLLFIVINTKCNALELTFKGVPLDVISTFFQSLASEQKGHSNNNCSSTSAANIAYQTLIYHNIL